MHPLATYLATAQSTTDHDPADDDVRAWSRQQASAAQDEARAPQPRRIVSILQVGVALLARRSGRRVARSA